MEISVIIAAYNAENTIREAALSVLDSDLDKEFEVIVVDDGSADGTAEKIKDLGVRVIRQENKGAAAARNAGAKAALGGLLVFIDSDVVFFKDTLRKIYGHLTRDDVDYVTGIYSVRPLNDGWAQRYRAIADHSYYYDLIFTAEQKKGPIRQVIIGGGIEGIKRKVFEKVGGFDEKIKGADVEQDKLALVLVKGGYNMIADADIVTRHHFAGFKKLCKDYFRRTLHVMGLVGGEGYGQAYIKKNVFRTALGGLTAGFLLLSLLLFSFFHITATFVIALLLFLAYSASHLGIFITAAREYGLLFMLYTVAMNLFFSLLISVAGCLGMARSLFAGR
ncbi:MAG: glycosyltransferase [Candidatus Omnitrophota bacterium]